MNKRGQAEIIGLVIVVLLLVFALIFFVKIKSDSSDTETSLIRNTVRVNSALNSVMKVYIKDKQMSDLIAECYAQSNGACGEVSDYLSQNLMHVFDSEYYFALQDFGGSVHIDNPGGKSMEFGTGKNCKSGIEASPYIIKDEGKVVLKICT